MKKALFISLLCCGFAMAETATPVVRLTFDDSESLLKNSIADPNNTYQIKNGKTSENGAANTINQASSDYLSNAAGGSFEAGNGAVIYISGTPLDLSKSFTLTFVAKAQSDVQNWCNILAVTANEQKALLQKDSEANRAYFWFNPGGAGQSGSTVTGSTMPTDAFTRLTLVYSAKSNAAGTFSLYQDDKDCLGTWTSGLGNSGALTLHVGGCNEQGTSADFDIDEVGVYTTALSAAQIKSLVGKASADAIPEPATATLSLLALAGLAARRRRK